VRGAATLIGAVLVAGMLGVGLSCAGDSPVGRDQSRVSDPDELSAQELRAFPAFPLYGLPNTFDGPVFNTARRVSTATLADDNGGGPPVQTITNAAKRMEDRAHEVVPDYVTLIYGDCVAAGDGGCAPPLEIQIWRACNRYLDDYELVPGTPYPHVAAKIRDTQAAEFDDRVELYAGSVTIVIFGDRAVAMRAAEALRPLNERARAEMPAGDDGPLPASAPGPDCT
jgi:hypothetical protein